jgi:hypothetical protein
MQRLLFTSIAAALLVALTGCPQSDKGGGTGKESSFTFDKVLTATTIKQGGADEVTLKINRGKDFKQGVKLSAENVPDKVKVEFTPTNIKASDDPKSVMRITADKEAALAESTITVKGTPESGTPTTVDVKIKVEKP